MKLLNHTKQIAVEEAFKSIIETAKFIQNKNNNKGNK